MTEVPKRPTFSADSVAAPLRHSVFRRIWLASLLSNLGLLIQGVGAAWAMTQMASSADKVALVQTALMLPIMLISMPAGAIADMYDRRIVALVSLGIALCGATALTVMAWLNLVTPEVLLAFCFIVLLNPVFLPYGALLNAAFSPVASQFVSLGTLTLHNVEFVFFELSATKLAFQNTMILCTSAATIGTVMAVVIAYMTSRKAIAWHKALGFLATAPVAVPGIVLGVGLFLSYARPPFVLYGTLWILLVAFVTIAMPAAYQQLQSAFRVVHPDLEEASRILGATRLQTLWRITAPLLRTSVIATWCFIFVGVIRELSAAIMLFTSQTKVISVLIFDLNESGDLGAIAVLGLLMLIVTFAVVVLINRMPGFGGAVRLRNN